MKIIRQNSWKTTIAGLFLIVFLYGLWLPMHNDDAYITARYARNLAAGHGFVYNPGERVLGTTTPLLTILFAGLMTVMPPLVAMRLVSALTLALCSIAFLSFGRRFGQPLAGLAAGCIFPAMGQITCFYGNEIPLCVALFLTCSGLARRRQAAPAGLAAGLLGLARGEGALYGGALGLYFFRRLKWRRLLAFGLCSLAVLGAWFLFSRIYFGDWMPRTLAIKRLQGRLAQTRGQSFEPFLEGARQFFRSSWLWPGSVFSVFAWLGSPWLLKRGGLLLLSWAVAHTALYALLKVANYPWYHYPLFALTAWSAGCGLELSAHGLYRIFPRLRPVRGRPWSLAVGLLIILVGGASSRQGLRRDSVMLPNAWMATRFEAYRQLGEFMAKHIAPGETALLDEIGIAGFFGWPVTILDGNSLIHRDLPGDLIGDPNALTLARRPQWVKTYHSQGEYYAAIQGRTTLVYERVREFRVSPHDPTLYHLSPAPPPQWMEGFYAAEDWGGAPVRWTRRGADMPFLATGSRLKFKYCIGHPDISEKNPVNVSLSVGKSKRLEYRHTQKGYFEQSVNLEGLTSGTQSLRIEVNRLWISPEGRHLGIAVYPLAFE